MRQDTNLDTLLRAKDVPKQEKRERRNYDFFLWNFSVL